MREVERLIKTQIESMDADFQWIAHGIGRWLFVWIHSYA